MSWMQVAQSYGWRIAGPLFIWTVTTTALACIGLLAVLLRTTWYRSLWRGLRFVVLVGAFASVYALVIVHTSTALYAFFDHITSHLSETERYRAHARMFVVCLHMFMWSLVASIVFISSGVVARTMGPGGQVEMQARSANLQKDETRA